MKKVIFAVGDLRMGGTQRVQSVIANELFLKDYDITFYSFIRFKSYFKILVKIIYSDSAIGLLKYIFILFSMMLRKFILKQNIDVILTPTKKDVECFIAYIKKNNVTTVVLVEQWVLVADEIKRALPTIKVIGWIHSSPKIYESFHFANSVDRLQKGFKACDYMIVLTREDEESMKKYRNNGILVLHNPLTVDSEGQKSDLSKKVISFVSRIDINHKGLDYLIEVAKNLDEDWQIHVAGKGGKFEEFKFLKMIKDNKLQKKIILKGSKKGKELAQHYLNSSIFISLSRFEGFGLVSVEAMSFGLPIISFANSGSKEITDNGKYGVLVEQGNVKQFCEHLDLFINSKEKRKEYQRLSIERVNAFNLENIICQWEKII